jgi:mono/diheme cytochrome c family protein
MKCVRWIGLTFLISAVTAQAQDPQEGAKWATNVCSECHAIARSQPRSPNERAPTFVELANASHIAPGGSRVFLASRSPAPVKTGAPAKTAERQPLPGRVRRPLAARAQQGGRMRRICVLATKFRSAAGCP